jgi:hypothetical protein
MSVTDSDDNILLQVNDEGDAGSLTLPQNAAAPADTSNKLHNVGGVLYWEDAQLGTGWTRTGTDVHLIDSGDNVGIGVADPDAKLEVNGQVKITGGSPGGGKLLQSDADGLAIWQTVNRPVANYIWGNMDEPVTANYGNYQEMKSVSITVPGPGIILVSATGTASFESANWDLVLTGICGNHEGPYSGDPNNSWTAEDHFWDSMCIVTDMNCTDPSDQYASFANQRGFYVNSAGTYTFRLWAQKYSTSAVTALQDIVMLARYYPN